MIPRFDNLTDSNLQQNRALLQQMAMSDPDQVLNSLNRIAAIFHAQSNEVETATDAQNSLQADLADCPQWYQSLSRVLRRAPSAEAIVQAVEQYLSRSRNVHSEFQLFDENPRSLEILARLACSSLFLTQILINEPGSLASLAHERRMAEMKAREDFRDQATVATETATSLSEKLDALRSFQHREILRIGMCDAFGLLDLKFVTLQISLLADALVQVCLQLICDEEGLPSPPFSVIALGKLGGEELNYSSDIDLIFITDHSTPAIQRSARRLIDLLSQHAASGFLYRVDMRLRPWGDAGPLVTTSDAYHQYLENDAELWEKQALLKARQIAGPSQAGTDFLNGLPELLSSEDETDVLNSIRRIKGFIEDRLRRAGRLETEVKLGAGSIRDIEFMVQALQLLHGGKDDRVYSPNTLDALVRLAELGILNAFEYRQLREGYIFLRTVEHSLQLAHNLQTHQLPDDHHQLDLLARRLDYPNRVDLLERFNEHRRAVRRTFQAYFKTGTAAKKAAGSEPANPESANPEASEVDSAATATGESDQQIPPIVQSDSLQSVFSKSSDDQQMQINDMLDELAPGNCCAVRIERSTDQPNYLTVMVAGLDTPEALSMICGCLVTRHLDIREAVISAMSEECGFQFQLPEGTFAGFFIVEPMDVEPVIIDASNRAIPDGQSTAMVGQTDFHTIARQLQHDLCRMMLDLREGQGHQMREQLVQTICERVKVARQSPIVDADLEIRFADDPSRQVTVMELHAHDSPGFFLELSGALALLGYRIQSAELRSHAGRVVDVLKITGSDGLPIQASHQKDELVAAVTIVKQFTHWLPSNSDPLNALLRFRDLLKALMAGPSAPNDVSRLKQPTILRDISHVLGLSHYLWEDFLMVRSQDFLDFVGDQQRLKTSVSQPELETELANILATAAPNEAKFELNRFKDRHLFRIDLRHVLGHCRPFGQFSTEITELADTVISQAAKLAWRTLADVHGPPQNELGTPCRYCIAGLGKFGGIEMGFASDLELFLVYECEGQTTGSASITNATFFERLVTAITDTISARRKGIFEIDLRMRPHGQAGSAAVSLRTVEEYFGPEGDCWPYERQSLVKLRPVGGCESFRSEVQQLRDSLVYDGRPFDFDAMRGFREQQVRQLVRAGTVNAKLSHGGLVDCEYAVQALQMTFGHVHPALRSSNSLTALNAAKEAGFVTAEQHQQVEAAYRFLREVIDCLRMVRGNAMDLAVPPEGTQDFVQLARRMDRVHDSAIPLQGLEQQMEAIRSFAADVYRLIHP